MIKKAGIISSQSKRVISAFGDIRGFRHWLARRTTSSEEFNNLIDKYYALLIKFRQEKSYFVKYLGDGFFVVKDLNGNNNDSDIACKMLIDCYELNLSIEKLIYAIPYPRPDGFRMRFVLGYARKIKIKEDTGIHNDYVGYTVNLSYSLLSIEPDIPLICHESIKELIKNKKNECIEFSRLPRQTNKIPDDIDKEDAEALWTYTIKNPKNV